MLIEGQAFYEPLVLGPARGQDQTVTVTIDELSGGHLFISWDEQNESLLFTASEVSVGVYEVTVTVSGQDEDVGDSQEEAVYLIDVVVKSEDISGQDNGSVGEGAESEKGTGKDG